MRIIAGKYKGRQLQRPPETITRPTTDRNREALFNILQHSSEVDLKGAIILDVFAGSGALGLEALSRGARRVTFVEKHPLAIKVLRNNIATLRCEDLVTLITGDALHLPQSLQPADLILIDPPYQSGVEASVLEELRRQAWLTQQTLIVLESAKSNKDMILPDWLALLDKRQYGNSVFNFLKLRRE